MPRPHILFHSFHCITRMPHIPHTCPHRTELPPTEHGTLAQVKGSLLELGVPRARHVGVRRLARMRDAPISLLG